MHDLSLYKKSSKMGWDGSIRLYHMLSLHDHVKSEDDTSDAWYNLVLSYYMYKDVNNHGVCTLALWRSVHTFLLLLFHHIFCEGSVWKQVDEGNLG